ncbi:phospholipid methyltransferase [Rhizobium sp. Root1203]|uniref:methyltransferase family protein n=1 Tax=Rhizobium sp. Root1203 TaxID=1736427 RepID=UPI00070DBCDA|nr:isoprenylcysteine carboxylmethyltransferase family protein [Rhizobium sp. Root1203]KQV24412.1 phospholipid methyltransferase [Rhizobium sp. Root1203]
MKSTMIKIGNFFFRFRNQVFPLLIVALFLLATPPLQLMGSAATERAKDHLALLVIVSGLALRATVIGFAYIQRGGLNKRVYAKDLVTEGMFGVCRNPLYVGNMLVYIGIFLLHGDPLVAVSGIALFAFIYQCIVYAEETFLEAKFGDAYKAYCRDVPRWGLRLSRFAESTQGMTFNVRRVIAKDYSTVASTCIAVLATEIYRFAPMAEQVEYVRYLVVLGLLMACVGIATAAVSHLKKRGAFREPKALY